MEDHVLGQGEQVFGDHVVAAVDQGPGPRALDQRDARARAGTQLDAGMVPRPRDDLDDVIGECLADVDVMDGLHGANQVFGHRDRAPFQHVELGAGDGPAVLAADAQRGVASQDLLLFVELRDRPGGGRA